MILQAWNHTNQDRAPLDSEKRTEIPHADQVGPQNPTIRDHKRMLQSSCKSYEPLLFIEEILRCWRFSPLLCNISYFKIMSWSKDLHVGHT